MMLPMLRPRPLFALVLAALAMVALLAPGAAHAGKPKRYHFNLIEVRLAPDLTGDRAVLAGLTTAVKAQADKTLAAHAQLVPTLVAPPAEGASFTEWNNYLAKEKLDGAYRVNIEITGYEESVEDRDPGDKVDLRLTIRLQLRMFGEVIPLRTMAFTGDGGSTVKADVGRKLRPKDRDFNLAGAVELAVNDALAASLHRLETAPPPETTKKKKPARRKK
jgi:hypothetical protein